MNADIPDVIVNDDKIGEFNIHVEVQKANCRARLDEKKSLWNVTMTGTITYSFKDNPEDCISITSPSPTWAEQMKAVNDWFDKHGLWLEKIQYITRRGSYMLQYPKIPMVLSEHPAVPFEELQTAAKKALFAGFDTFPEIIANDTVIGPINIHVEVEKIHCIRELDKPGYLRNRSVDSAKATLSCIDDPICKFILTTPSITLANDIDKMITWLWENCCTDDQIETIQKTLMEMIRYPKIPSQLQPSENGL